MPLARNTKKKIHEISSKFLLITRAAVSERVITLPNTLALIFSSNPVVQGRRVILLKTQSKASFASARLEALKIPMMDRTTSATTQGIVLEHLSDFPQAADEKLSFFLG